MERVCEESTTATIAISTSSNFKPIYNGLFDLMDVEWGIFMSSRAKMVCTLDFKFAIQREQGWDCPQCKFQTNPLKFVPTARIVRKQSFLAGF